MLKYVPVIILVLFVSACKKQSPTLFKKRSSEDTGIKFRNDILENDTLNILTLEYIYNGAGVAVADFNNDGKSDLFFTGNVVENKLYLNKGSFEFEDVSLVAGIGAKDKWKSSVAIADVNGDGWKDIYVCATILPDSSKRENMLFIHQGLDKDGKPVFTDRARDYGVNYAGHSSGAAFIDYDNDGDLDLFILTNTILRGVPTSYRPKIADGTMNADVLLRNNGNGTFSNVSKDAGILEEGYGLGVSVADINQDGWQDIYVSNDYISNDLLYINNKNGTFTNDINRCMKHQSMFSMGNDIADINNDGHLDLITLDMLPEGNLRRKTVIGGASYSSYLNNERYGYAHQYIRNVLQLNNGDGTFSDIGQLAGVHQTEWSWSPLFVDVDNDGNRDLLITNGFPRDITDKDFGNFRAETGNIASVQYQMDSIPVVKVSNYAFKNNGDLTFKDVSKSWGLDDPAFSNGAAFADLDNDGDVDYIVNNINDEVMVYENTLYHGDDNEKKSNHYLRVKLEGPTYNLSGLGAKVKMYYDGRMQYHDHSIYRGYISTVEDVIHFGSGQTTKIDSLIVEWSDDKRNVHRGLAADRIITISYKDAKPFTRKVTDRVEPLFIDVADKSNIEQIHEEDDKIDFNVQRTLPHKFSQNGPGLAVGDVDGNGLEDFYLGGSANHDGFIFKQSKSGSFEKSLLTNTLPQKEDQGSLFFDADNDKDLDLYIVSGSYEFPVGSQAQDDKLYLNDGKGNFKLASDALPPTPSNGSCVRASDFDDDGDLDLFVGGKVVPGQYPYASESYLLINSAGKFSNESEARAPGLATAGIINDALWTDVDNDGNADLMLAGEFMPLTIYHNDGGGKLSKMESTGLEKYSGWWNSIAAGDFDRDGDIDYIGGNLGQNNLYRASADMPLRVYAKDFDGNGSVDAILSCYLLAESGERKEFPVHFWEELNSQSPKFRRKFKYYKKYGVATLDQVLTEEDRKDAMVLTANWTYTSYIENQGKGKFAVRALPNEVQTAPVNGIISSDVNGDGLLDVVMVGNDYGNEVNVGRLDAFTGIVLINAGMGNFQRLSIKESGFKAGGDAKSLVKLNLQNNSLVLVGQNRDSLKVFSHSKGSVRFFYPEKTDRYAEVVFKDGKKLKHEFYYGSGYLSQSSRALEITDKMLELTVFGSEGRSRKITLGQLSASRD